MKKGNVRTTADDQTQRAVKRARRERRKAKRDEIIAQKIKPLLVRLGALQSQINNFEKEKQRGRLEGRQAEAGSVADTESGASTGG